MTSKIFNFSRYGRSPKGRQSIFIHRARQQGVTLIMAIVMLAVTTFISFSLSVIVVREIKGARLVLQTEPAISGANAGGEVGLYQYTRQTGFTTLSGSLPQSGVDYEIKTELFDDPYLVNSNTEPAKVSLYDPVNPDNQNADYKTVTVKNTGSPSSIRFRVFSWSDPVNPVCNWTTVPSGQSRTCNNLTAADDRYVVEIEKEGASTIVIAEVTTTNELNQSKGVPSNSPVIEVTGKHLEVQRKIEINLQ